MIRLSRIGIAECETLQFLAGLLIICLPRIVIIQIGIADEIDRTVRLLCRDTECGEVAVRLTEIIGFDRHADCVRLEVIRRLIRFNGNIALHPRNIGDVIRRIFGNLRMEAERLADYRRLDAADRKGIVIADDSDLF